MYIQVNRYFAPIHIATYLLAIYYLVKNNSRFFKILLFAAIGFGSLHFLYLRTVYHPFSRTANMDIVNNPPGSYQDNQTIGQIIKEERNNKLVYYSSQIVNEKGSVNYRQANPNLFALANGAIILNPDSDLSSYNNAEESVFYSVFTEEVILDDKWQIEYQGKVYSLWKYCPD